MVKITTAEPGVALRTDNIEGDRIVPATDWWLWAIGVFFLLIGGTESIVGILEYAVGAVAILAACILTFWLKKVQVLKNGRWETLASMARPSQATEIASRLRAR